MSVRKRSAKVGMAAIAVSGLVLSVWAPANADTKPGDTGVAGSYVLSTNDQSTSSIIGVGSDTIQWIDDQLAKDYDNQSSTPTHAWANFDACLGNTTTGAPGLGDNPDLSGFPCGADHSGTKAGVKRDEDVVDSTLTPGVSLPSGSGDGRTLLQTTTDPLFQNVAYARSSGPLNAGNVSNGLLALPFAVDKIVVVTHPGGPAPASLTGKQILNIFSGNYTNWDQVGGKNAPIHPYMPKSGSSTLNAFEAFLAGLDNVTEAPGSDNDMNSHSAARQQWQGPGNTVTNSNWNTGTVNVEEHDPSVVIADPNAIEPFSYARAQLANGELSATPTQTVRIEGGWSADRELYHVVRGQPFTAKTNQFIYGSDSGILEALFSPTTGWVCNNSTAQTDIANAGFWPLQQGTALNDCGVSNPNTVDSIGAGLSYGIGEGAVTSTSASYFNGSIHIQVSNTATPSDVPTGKVQVSVADPVSPGLPAKATSYHTTVTLDSNGTAVVKLPPTVSGTKIIDAAYLPTDFGALSTAGGHDALGSSWVETTPMKVAGLKIATTEKASAKPLTLANATKSTKITATVTAASGTTKPTGKIEIMRGTKVIATGTLKASTGKSSKAVVTVKGTKLVKGKNKLVVKYVASTIFKAPKSFPSVTITRTT